IRTLRRLETAHAWARSTRKISRGARGRLRLHAMGGGHQQFEYLARRPHRAVVLDGDNVDGANHQGRALSVHDLTKIEHRTSESRQFRDDFKQIVYGSRRRAFHLQFPHRKGEAVRLNEQIVLKAATSQPFSTAPL